MSNYWETHFVRSFWHRNSSVLLQHKLISRCCRTIHRLARKHQQRTPQATYTRFFRNRPQLSVLTGVLAQQPERARVKVAVLGCSTGAELYSAAFKIFEKRPDIDIDAVGLDISSAAIEIAKEGLYSHNSHEVQGLSETEQAALFDRRGDRLGVKSTFMRCTRWLVGDACDPDLRETLGEQDVVFANNFLVHLEDQAAEQCLRNIVNLVRPGGFLFVWGCDPDIRSRVASELKLEVVDRNIREIHAADEKALRLYPWLWWTLEPIDLDRADWKMRYGTVFRVP